MKRIAVRKPGTARLLDEMLCPETVIVHWYNSVESRLGGKALTAAWVDAHPETAFAEMVRRWGRPEHPVSQPAPP